MCIAVDEACLQILLGAPQTAECLNRKMGDLHIGRVVEVWPDVDEYVDFQG